VVLRPVASADLPVFFEHQRDPEATRMAAFPSRDHEAFLAHWKRTLDRPDAVIRTILCDGAIAGNVLSWVDGGDRLVGYWLGREYWGRGIATRALSAFLGLLQTRPLYAHAARHNAGSLRVLEKCGFRFVEERPGPSDVPGVTVPEHVMILEPE